MPTSQPSKLLYCYLREKYTTLEIVTRDDSEGEGAGRQNYRCLSRDDICSARRCRLSEFGGEHPEESRDPWFDD